MSGEACSHSFCIAIFLQMEIRHLLQSQANTLLDAMRSDCWQINEFNWEDIKSPNYTSTDILASKLVHQSNYYFVFDNYGGNFFQYGLQITKK